jgi:DNA-binding LytR/AlgR family response regulator
LIRLFIYKLTGIFLCYFFEDEKRVICKSPLIRLQNILPIYFERVHNSYIININYINFIDFNTKIIQLNNKITTKIGNHYKDNIEKYFLNINKQINT